MGLTCIHPQTFEKQIHFLISEGYRFVTLSGLQSTPDGNDKTVAICFDDGYQGIFDHAYPILQKYDVVATVFMIGGYIGKRNTWDVNLGGITYDHLDSSALRELVENGWEIGSHSLSHRSLRSISREELDYELSQSKHLLEHMTHSKVVSFTPPFGVVTSRLYSAAIDYGYQNICGFYPLKYWHEKTPAHLFLRLAVYRGESIYSIKRKLSSHKHLYFEVLKQNIINFCSNGTLAVNSLR